jgi:hypothetical protein
MMNERRLVLSLALGAALAAACQPKDAGDDHPTTATADAGPSQDGATIAGMIAGGTGGGTPATAGSGGAAGSGGTAAAGGADAGAGGADAGAGAGGSAGSLRSNIPGLRFEYTGTDPAGRGLQILSSNLTQEMVGIDVFQEWLAEVKNGGDETVCLVRIKATFLAGATILADVDSYAEGPPYKADFNETTSACLAPGDTGVFWDLDEVPRLTAIDTATTAEYRLVLLGDDLLRPAPATLKVTPEGVMDRYGTGGGWSLHGSATAGETIYNIALDIFPIDDRGLVTASLGAVHLDTLPVGTSWTFDSSTAKRPFSQQHIFAEWIGGEKAAVRRTSPSLFAGDELREQFRRQRHALVQRRDLLRAPACVGAPACDNGRRGSSLDGVPGSRPSPP